MVVIIVIITAFSIITTIIIIITFLSLLLYLQMQLIYFFNYLVIALSIIYWQKIYFYLTNFGFFNHVSLSWYLLSFTWSTTVADFIFNQHFYGAMYFFDSLYLVGSFYFSLICFVSNPYCVNVCLNVWFYLFCIYFVSPY